jgi:hypothetical protein
MTFLTSDYFRSTTYKILIREKTKLFNTNLTQILNLRQVISLENLPDGRQVNEL